ncbi:peroxidase 12-like [Corylus avellana]|uniref:peroxidase 12-like n=1 Tax=Corylus avellana TaxID=13451 RepID=UPI00286C705E|nr:peroxidase 12-like [Corylus avellana]
MAGFVSFPCVLLISSLLLASYACASEVELDYSSLPIETGLSWDFYDSSCPKLESIIRTELKKIFEKDIGQAAGLLRVHFHDCFVKGCDSTVLLDGSAEKNAEPNKFLRATAFEIIDDLRELVHKECGRVVSCSDITALAARDSVFLSKGPDYNVPLGRRDGLSSATEEETLENLPSPDNKTGILIDALALKNLDATDLVALSGAHTIGLAHCSAFCNRLYPTQDPTMDDSFAADLKKVCPTEDCPPTDSNTTTVEDILTPDEFDNAYYVNLVNRQGLFTSDQDLYTDSRTKDIVTSFAVNKDLFFEQFAKSMIKMGQLSVLTGNDGEIRANCSVINSDNVELIKTVVEEDEDAAEF